MQPPRTASPLARAAAVVIVGMLALGACSSDEASPAAGKQGDTVAALLASGMAAQGKGDAETAAAAYKGVLATDPTNKYALYNLGTIDQLAGRAAEAEPKYRAALASDPNFEPALFNLAIVRTTSAPQEAADLYEKVIALDPERAGAHFNLGVVQRSLGRAAEADRSFARARELDPTLKPPT